MVSQLSPQMVALRVKLFVCFRHGVLVPAGHRAHQEWEARGGVVPGVSQGHLSHQDGGLWRWRPLRQWWVSYLQRRRSTPYIVESMWKVENTFCVRQQIMNHIVEFANRYSITGLCPKYVDLCLRNSCLWHQVRAPAYPILVIILSICPPHQPLAHED